MPFRNTDYSRLPTHCKDVLETNNLVGKIDFVSMNSKLSRIVFNVALTNGEKTALQASSCFNKLMDPFVDVQAVFFDRFED